MTTTVPTPASAPSVPTAPLPLMKRRAERPAPRRIPTTRIVAVELRKMFNTRSGFWLMASIGILSLIATSAAILFAPAADLDFEMYASAVGVPMSVILPMLAVLSVTSEWSQRSGLTTFTIVPDRGRVIFAKFLATVVVGVLGMVAALTIGAIGNLVGSAITGNDPVWNVSAVEFARIVFASELGMLLGFMLGVLIRNSAAAIVAFFVCTLVVPTVSQMLAVYQDWYADLQAWVDFNAATAVLYDAAPTGEQWAQIGTSSLIWMIIPLTIGLLTLMRSEVK